MILFPEGSYDIPNVAIALTTVLSFTTTRFHFREDKGGLSPDPKDASNTFWVGLSAVNDGLAWSLSSPKLLAVNNRLTRDAT